MEYSRKKALLITLFILAFGFYVNSAFCDWTINEDDWTISPDWHINEGYSAFCDWTINEDDWTISPDWHINEACMTATTPPLSGSAINIWSALGLFLIAPMISMGIVIFVIIRVVKNSGYKRQVLLPFIGFMVFAIFTWLILALTASI